MTTSTATLAVRAGEIFEVALASAGSAGYRWQIDSLPDGVALLGGEVRAPPGAQVGDAGTQVFHLRAGAAGQWPVRFVLKRRWETDPVETRIIELQVR